MPIKPKIRRAIEYYTAFLDVRALEIVYDKSNKRSNELFISMLKILYKGNLNYELSIPYLEQEARKNTKFLKKYEKQLGSRIDEIKAIDPKKITAIQRLYARYLDQKVEDFMYADVEDGSKATFRSFYVRLRESGFHYTPSMYEYLELSAKKYMEIFPERILKIDRNEDVAIGVKPEEWYLWIKHGSKEFSKDAN